MNARDPGIDAAFEGLRRAHRAERAPDALRQRVLERARQARAGQGAPPPRSTPRRSHGWLAVAAAAAVAAGSWLLVSRTELDGSAAPKAERDAVTPTAEPSRRAAPPATCPRPLPAWPWHPADIDTATKLMGLESRIFKTETLGCGPFARRYLLRTDRELTATAPLLIVLHDGGHSPEQVQVETRWWFDDLAQRERVALVYANGTPAVGPLQGQWINAGVWQTDPGAHPAIDDVAYLQALSSELGDKDGLGQGEVFLAGNGSGGLMALRAALREPGRYTGVAAFLPPRAPLKTELGPVLAAGAERRLRSIFVALTRAADENPSQLALDWAAALGSEAGPVHVTRQRPGVRRIDTSLANGLALRIVTLPEEVNPFPGPGGAEPLARAASEKLPHFFDGPGAAWTFFMRAKP